MSQTDNFFSNVLFYYFNLGNRIQGAETWFNDVKATLGNRLSLKLSNFKSNLLIHSFGRNIIYFNHLYFNLPKVFTPIFDFSQFTKVYSLKIVGHLVTCESLNQKFSFLLLPALPTPSPPGKSFALAG